MHIFHNFAFVCIYSTVDVYVLYRSAYDDGDVQISKIAGGMRVNIGSTMEFDLHELTASDRRSELQHLLVGMGRLIETLQTNLTGSGNSRTGMLGPRVLLTSGINDTHKLYKLCS